MASPESLKCQTTSSKEKEIFDRLKAKLDSSAFADELAERISRGLLEPGKQFFGPIGEKKAFIYSEAKSQSPEMTPESYFKYISSFIETPADVKKAINPPFVFWNNDDTDKDDKLREGYMTLATAKGDCDNISWLAKRLLEELGCKKGFDYQPRVIGIGDHACCIYKDQDGKYYSIDQGAEIKQFDSIYEASKFFTGKQESPEETILFIPDKVQYQISLNSENLKPNYDFLGVRVLTKYDKKTFAPKSLLPKDWEKHKKVEIHFLNDESVVFYEKGIITQEDYKDKIVKYKGGVLYSKDEDNKVTFYFPGTENILEIHYNSGHIKGERFDRSGKLENRTFANGTSEFYENGKLVQKNNEDKTVEFFENGIVIEKKYPDGTIEFFKNGKVIQRKFQKDKHSFEIEWYDEDGKLVQTKDWKGKINTIK